MLQIQKNNFFTEYFKIFSFFIEAMVDIYTFKLFQFLKHPKIILFAILKILDAIYAN